MRRVTLILSLFMAMSLFAASPVSEWALYESGYDTQSTDSASVSAPFEMDFSTFSSNKKHEWSTYVANHNLFVEGLEVGTVIEVYSITGARVVQTTALENVTQISGLRGIYIVRADGRALKVTVK